MPVTTKIKLDKIKSELTDRYTALIYTLVGRPLKSNKEGAGRGHWSNPEMMQATNGTVFDIQLAIDDFKNILSQIRSLK